MSTYSLSPTLPLFLIIPYSVLLPPSQSALFFPLHPPPHTHIHTRLACFPPGGFKPQTMDLWTQRSPRWSYTGDFLVNSRHWSQGTKYPLRSNLSSGKLPFAVPQPFKRPRQTARSQTVLYTSNYRQTKQN